MHLFLGFFLLLVAECGFEKTGNLVTSLVLVAGCGFEKNGNLVTSLLDFSPPCSERGFCLCLQKLADLGFVKKAQSSLELWPAPSSDLSFSFVILGTAVKCGLGWILRKLSINSNPLRDVFKRRNWDKTSFSRQEWLAKTKKPNKHTIVPDFICNILSMLIINLL